MMDSLFCNEVEDHTPFDVQVVTLTDLRVELFENFYSAKFLFEKQGYSTVHG
jgi:hypothetical protein